MSKFRNLTPELDAIEAFGFWLKHCRPGWSISRPTVEHLPSGEPYPLFALYEQFVPMGVYKTPLEALARMNDDELTSSYLAIVSASGESSEDTP